MFALDVSSAIVIECPAGVAGAYGKQQSRKLNNGAYFIVCDADVVVREGSSTTLPVGTDGNKLALFFSPGVVSPPILVTRGSVVVAAKAAAAVVWLVPLVNLEGHLQQIAPSNEEGGGGGASCT